MGVGCWYMWCSNLLQFGSHIEFLIEMTCSGEKNSFRYLCTNLFSLFVFLSVPSVGFPVYAPRGFIFNPLAFYLTERGDGLDNCEEKLSIGPEKSLVQK